MVVHVSLTPETEFVTVYPDSLAITVKSVSTPQSGAYRAVLQVLSWDH